MKKINKKFGLAPTPNRVWSWGFTLIEMLIAVAIFVLIFSLASAVTINIIHTKAKGQLQLQVSQEARNILETIMREARLAGGDGSTPAITIPGNLASGDKVTLTLSPKVSKLYQLITNGNVKQIQVDETKTVVETTDEETNETLGIELIVDVSGSMDSTIDGQKKINDARDALTNFMGIIEKNKQESGLDHKVGLVEYATEAKVLAPISGDYATIDNAIKNLAVASPSIAGTNMGDGMKLAEQDLIDAQNKSPNFWTKPVFILLSDGCANLPMPDPPIRWNLAHTQGTYDPNNTQWHTGIDEVVAWAQQYYPDKILPIYTFGFGNKDKSVSTGSGNISQPDVNGPLIIDGYPETESNNRWFGQACFDINTLNQISISTGLPDGASYGGPSDLQKFYDGLANSFIHATKTTQTTMATNLTSTAVWVDDLSFAVKNLTGQPYLETKLTVSTPDYTNPNLPAWKKAQIKVNTVISSRDYQ